MKQMKEENMEISFGVWCGTSTTGMSIKSQLSGNVCD